MPNRLLRALPLLVLSACPKPQQPTSQPTTLPGLRPTEAPLCQLSYRVQFTEEGATIEATASAPEEELKSYQASGQRLGEETLFYGKDLFQAPKACQEADVTITAQAPQRAQISTGLFLRDDGSFGASSVRELQQSLFGVGRESELRMLSGAFTALLIQDAQTKEGEISSLVSEAQRALGEPSGRVMLVLSPALKAPNGLEGVMLNSDAQDLTGRLADAVVSLWLPPGGARDYYGLLLRARAGLISPEELAKELPKNASAARFFCFDVLSRDKGASLDAAMQRLLSDAKPIDERSVSSQLSISACTGDGLSVASGMSGLSKGQVKDPEKLRAALGL